MKRVLVIGNSGAGKSTLATELGRRLNLPVMRLDAYRWQSPTEKVPEPQFRTALNRLIKQPEWVMDGNYRKYLPVRLKRADTVILLDRPAWLCGWRVLRRHFQDGFAQESTAADGRNLIPIWTRDFASFFWWVIWRYYRTNRPEVLRMLEPLSKSKSIVRLRTQREIDVWLASLAAKHQS